MDGIDLEVRAHEMETTQAAFATWSKSLARRMRTFYEQLRKAGFEEDQAMGLVAQFGLTLEGA